MRDDLVNHGHMHQHDFTGFERKMAEAGVNASAIRAFGYNYGVLAGGEDGMMPETSIEPVEDLPRMERVVTGGGKAGLLARTVIIKLNGGLGTGMGLEKAKSLLEVKDGLTFLDLIARQVLQWRKTTGEPLRFLLLNSFSTSADTRDFLTRYPELGEPEDLELMQSQAPKVDAASLQPVEWPKNPLLEWCPPGHGDIYPALLGSGLLDQLLSQGIRYAFVSNSDNLGACLDTGLLTYFAEADYPFMMEVAERTEMDIKGGHLARRGGRFILRETAQCPASDLAAFQDIERHRFFNTNNLWIRLDRLRELLVAEGGFLRLPLIKNVKTVDPREKESPKVIQLETAMGAAIQSFENSGAVVVPRNRFAPVKTTSDLLLLRSDVYQLTPDYRLLACSEDSKLPVVELDPNYYKLVEQLDQLCPYPLALNKCRKLKINGPIAIGPNTAFRGEVRVNNPTGKAKPLAPGSYENQTLEL